MFNTNYIMASVIVSYYNKMETVNQDNHNLKFRTDRLSYNYWQVKKTDQNPNLQMTGQNHYLDKWTTFNDIFVLNERIFLSKHSENSDINQYSSLS